MKTYIQTRFMNSFMDMIDWEGMESEARRFGISSLRPSEGKMASLGEGPSASWYTKILDPSGIGVPGETK